MDNSPYMASTRAALPRVLSMLDREPLSKTFGCADRVFWSWKFTDFPGARFQEIAYVLAELAVNPALGSGAFQPDTLLAWTKATINFWSTLQHSDGSFDEAYPYERSLAATAFTGFYVGQAFLKIRPSYSAEEQSRLAGVFRSAGDWLCLNDERHGILSNHLAAAAAALDTIAEITSEERFIARRDYFVDRILTHQSEEGWYEEYGGADPGYQTHTTFYLGYVWERTKNKKLLESLEQSIRYFWHFVHVDGSMGGEYGSRNTRFFMPAGFEILARAIPEAAAVSHVMRASLDTQHAVGMHAMDAQNILPFINNYIFAFKHAQSLDKQALPPLPYHTIGIKKYDGSGHMVLSMPQYQAIIATSKGGVLSAFSKKPQSDQPPCSNAGVVLEFVDGKKASSQGLGCSHVRHMNDQSVAIESHFTEINQMLMSPQKFMVLRLISLFSILSPSFAYWLKNLLVKILVRRKKLCPARLLRRITWDNQGIWVSDEVTVDKPHKVKNILAGGRFSAVHMGSSRYFEWQELAHPVLPVSLPEQQIEQLNETGKLVINSHWQA